MGPLLCVLLWPGHALAYAQHGGLDNLQSGLTSGVAIACALAFCLAWAHTRNAMYAAGLAFVLVEGLFRSMPSLMPPGALQAGSFAALLASTAPLIQGSRAAGILAAACRWSSVALAGVAALALIFVYETESGLLPTSVAGVCAVLSLPLAVWFCAKAVRQAAGRASSVALALAYGASAWMLGRDAWAAGGADTAGTAVELFRLLLVSGALLWLALDSPLRGAAGRKPADLADVEHQAQGELRVAELAGALETQRQMNALISHELRAPLATISAAAQSLDMILSGSGETVDSRLARIHRSVTRMTELMDQLLNQDRLDEQAWTPRGEQTDMAELVRDVVTAMQPDTAHSLVLQAQTSLPVYCDRPLTSVVVRNLIHNAIKYSPANEPVRIETGHTRVGDQPMTWTAVVDRGPGIGEEEQARIFEPRFRRSAHRETPGMGIGLFLARRICQSQGGTLTMQSKVGVGTRFVITLPANGPAA
ncbi:His Kinase A phosphoacceptor domain-containing protein 6 [Achromobacter arsenitoxydans SY8]|uniref:histidine kinase n=1 Tax=Achromobacter arsenitoxydans SY8 TaxID=477184 RepID=H0FAB4_9BURK|nr:His Kinase A phosphoacceptor domain-containing protein 6 [Achromobacter arsenitoxydans SY8]